MAICHSLNFIKNLCAFGRKFFGTINNCDVKFVTFKFLFILEKIFVSQALIHRNKKMSYHDGKI